MAKKKTPEEQEKYMMEASLEEVLKRNIPEPPEVFNVGDRVVYGAWEYTEILEVFEDGLYYLVYQKTKRIEYGIFKGYKEEKRYHPWFHLKPFRYNDEFPKQITENKDIYFNFTQRQLDHLISLCHRGKKYLNLNPKYQRGNVWSHDQKIDLVDSIFKNIDIGKFVIIHNGFSDENEYYYEILDGKQRINAICEFFEGKLKYRGMTYFDLHPFDQKHFKNYSISYAESRKLTDKQKYRYFLKLNKTGKPVDSKHIEKVEKMLEKENDK